MATNQTTPIVNRMQDCGAGRHVGWWGETHLDHKHLLIEVTNDCVLFSICLESKHPRISFVVDREKAIGIALALANALGLECADEGLQEFANRMERDFEREQEERATRG
jgi:hypothetical protein